MQEAESSVSQKLEVLSDLDELLIFRVFRLQTLEQESDSLSAFRTAHLSMLTEAEAISTVTMALAGIISEAEGLRSMT